MTNLTNGIKKDRGFTIVELLVVIVVIGILAAITIVSYTGITQQAKTAKAQSNAQSAQNVAEIMNADNGSYPITFGAFATGSTTTKLPAGITVIAGQTGAAGAYTTPATVPISATNGETTVTYACMGTPLSGTPTSCLTTGGRITYWNFTTSAQVAIYVGAATSTSQFFAPAS